MSTDAPKPVPSSSDADSVSGCAVKLGWTFGGVALVLVSAIAVARQPMGPLTVRDLVFWIAVLAVICLRFLDVAHFHGRTMDGDPATPRDAAKFAAGVALASVLLWTLAHFVKV